MNILGIVQPEPACCATGTGMWVPQEGSRALGALNWLMSILSYSSGFPGHFNPSAIEFP